jgi:choline dehydrogenase-like flavoprotein
VYKRHAYIQPVRSHPNVRILTGSTVEKLIFNDKKTKAVIVNYKDHEGVSKTCELAAKKGVILSAGALRTPQILLRSGVGPAADLEALGIPVVNNNVHVGQHLDDHPGISDQYIGFTKDSLYSANLNGHAYWNHKDDPSMINDWTLQIVGFLPTDVIPPGLKAGLTQLMNQKSRGSVKIQANGEPIFDMGYFNDLEDLLPAALGYNKTLEVAGKLGYYPITPVSCPAFLPHCMLNLTSYYTAAFLQYGTVGYHFVGTCALEKVVSPVNGKVYGFDDLHIVDASVLPKSPRGNTQLSVYALAEKLASAIF